MSGMVHAGRPLSTSSNGGGGRGNGWFMPGQSRSSYVSFLFSLLFVKLMKDDNDNRASQHSLSTPDSHSHPAHLHHQYTPFLLSSSQDMLHHLPPLHHSHPHSHHAHSHSLPKGLVTQAVNLMALPPYDPLPPQNQHSSNSARRRNRELEQELEAYRHRSRSSSSMEPPLTDSGTGGRHDPSRRAALPPWAYG